MLNKAVINLNILKENALNVKSKLSKDVKFCAVVKADAYGHGACVVANALYPYVDCFAVALPEEGVALRRAGIDKEILCLNPPFIRDAQLLVDYNITCTVYTFNHVDLLRRAAKKSGVIANVHIKFNAGMNRQGVDDIRQLNELIEYCDKSKRIKITGTYSHLSAPENKNTLKSQVNKFLLANNLVKGYNNKVICHVSASGGFLKGVEADMVRIGILLYGYKPFESKFVKVKPVMKVYAPPLCKRFIKTGESALYGTHTATAPTEVTLVRYGYADGLFRKETDGQFNNRCMDLTAVTNGKSCRYGYEIMGNADQVAKRYGTISYEVLTKSALRAEKIYIR